MSWRRVIRRIYIVPYRTHNELVAKLGRYIISRLDRRLAIFVFGLINHDNTVVKYITKFKLKCPHSTLAENYLLYKYNFSHLNLYSDIVTVGDSVTYTVREVC